MLGSAVQTLGALPTSICLYIEVKLGNYNKEIANRRDKVADTIF